MDEMMILSMLLCIGLAVVGMKMRMWPVVFISSIGWTIISIQIFDDTGDYLVLSLMIMLAMAQVLMARDAEARRWLSISRSKE